MTRTRQSIVQVPLSRLTSHPANIREDLGDLSEMAQSIREHGILQPLTATEDLEHPGQLLLLAGHRRLGAARQAGITTIPVIVRHDVTDPAEHLVVMLVENTQRRDLNPIEKAEAFGALRNQGLSPSEIARRVGCTPSNVSYYLNFLLLDEFEREEVRTGVRNSTEAAADVRDRRQEAREAVGMPLRGRPRGKAQLTQGSWFNAEHRLARTVRDRCTHRHQPQVGKVGCGPCWEQALLEEQAATPNANRQQTA